MNNLLYAKYTILLYDVLREDPTFLNFLELDTQEHSEKFRKIFAAKWGMYEIGGETPEQFKIFVQQDFDLHKDYYIEKINMYEKEFNLTEGILTSVTTERETKYDGTKSIDTSLDYTNINTGNTSGTNSETLDHTITDNGTTGSYETQYGLPNKDTTNRYPTSKTTNDVETSNTKKLQGTTSNTLASSLTNNETLEQTGKDVHVDDSKEIVSDTKTFKGQLPTYEIKEKALATIRNIYEEFANRFKECFILLF